MSRLTRRAFLQLGGLSLGALVMPPLNVTALRWATLPPGPDLTRLPAPAVFAHSQHALAHLAHFDLALLPAPVTAWLIEQGALHPMPGGPSRPHDPEGAFTRPAGLTRLAVRLSTPPRAPLRLAEALAGPVSAPPEPRWAQAVWLVAHGRAPNTVHPGWQAQAAQATAAWLVTRFAPVTLVWQSLALALPPHTHWPVEVLRLEWDWVIPRASRAPRLAHTLAERHAVLLPPAPAGSFTLV